MNSKFALLLAYEGTHYCGWQKQRGSAASGRPSIQSTIEGAARSILGATDAPDSVVGSGRTDAGVHATGQVAHLWVPARLGTLAWEGPKLAQGLNSKLPHDIRVLAARPVDPDFHAQHSASKKQYSYYFQQGPQAPPHLRPYSRWIRRPLDLSSMRVGLAHIVGAHDFRAFQSAGAPADRTTVRTIYEAELEQLTPLFPGTTPIARAPLELIRMRLVGSGFLKQMVRGIAGTLLQVGEGERSPDCFKSILASRDRASVGPTAPGRGLWLERVWYGQDGKELEW